MYGYTDADIRRINRSVDKIERGINEFSALIVYEFAPSMWLDFLNADPMDGESMWLVYQSLTRIIGGIKRWIRKQGQSCSEDIENMRILTKAEFLKQYPLDHQEDAQKLHAGMKEVIDKGMGDVMAATMRYIDREKRPTKATVEKRARAERILTGGALIPPLSFTVIPALVQVDGRSSEQLQLYTPAARHPRFWLSIIYEGTIMAYDLANHEITVRRCEAPDCRKYFVPAYRSHGQRYHSKACQNRDYMRKRRNKKTVHA